MISQKIFTNFAKPHTILAGNQDGLYINIILSSILFVIYNDAIITNIIFFCSIQLVNFYLTYKNPHYIRKLIIYFKHKNTSAILNHVEYYIP